MPRGQKTLADKEATSCGSLPSSLTFILTFIVPVCSLEQLCNVRILLFQLPLGLIYSKFKLQNVSEQKIKWGDDEENGEIAQEMLHTDKNVVRKIH